MCANDTKRKLYYIILLRSTQRLKLDASTFRALIAQTNGYIENTVGSHDFRRRGGGIARPAIECHWRKLN